MSRSTEFWCSSPESGRGRGSGVETGVRPTGVWTVRSVAGDPPGCCRRWSARASSWVRRVYRVWRQATWRSASRSSTRRSAGPGAPLPWGERPSRPSGTAPMVSPHSDHLPESAARASPLRGSWLSRAGARTARRCQQARRRGPRRSRRVGLDPPRRTHRRPCRACRAERAAREAIAARWSSAARRRRSRPIEWRAVRELADRLIEIPARAAPEGTMEERALSSPHRQLPRGLADRPSGGAGGKSPPTADRKPRPPPADLTCIPGALGRATRALRSPPGALAWPARGARRGDCTLGGAERDRW